MSDDHRTNLKNRLLERAQHLHAAAAWGSDMDGWLMEKAAQEIQKLEHEIEGTKR